MKGKGPPKKTAIENLEFEYSKFISAWRRDYRERMAKKNWGKEKEFERLNIVNCHKPNPDFIVKVS